MARIITAPEESYTLYSETETKMFLAGGITDCPDWQAEFCRHFINTAKLTIYNPRRTFAPDGLEEQIIWEHRKLREADIIVYWFAAGSVNPITLYELGLFLTSDKHIVIGTDPDYPRKKDVEIQAKLIREVCIGKNFEQFVALTKKQLLQLG